MKKRTGGIIIGLIAVLAILFFVWPRESNTETIEVETTTVTQEDFRDIISTVGIIQPVETETFVGQGLVNEVNVALDDKVEADEVLVTYLDGNQFIAPFAGTVVELNVEEEAIDANAQQTQPSLVLANLDNLEVVVNLAKSDANSVKTDQVVELEYLGNQYRGYISHVDAIASGGAIGGSSLQAAQSTPVLSAVITFDEDEDTSELIAGFDIDANIVVESTTDSLSVPIESIMYNEDGKPFVYVVEDGIIHAREIEVGIQEGVALEVRSGLELDEEVVRLPSEDLEDGMEVTIANSDSGE